MPEAIEQVVEDDAEDEAILPSAYAVSSYGADWDVEGVIKRLDRGTVFVPKFQRDFIWTMKEASRFIESLLLGLPVPGIFVAKESGSNKLVIVDGQQRCKSLQFFAKGVFNPKPGDQRRTVFALTGVCERFLGKTYETLEDDDRIRFDDSIIHATVIKQDSPKDDNTAMYHVFERLNSGGRRLAPQEIRVAAFHGTLLDAVSDMDSNADWRTIFGTPSKRLKDQELILRFLALVDGMERYERPMKEFLNKFARTHRNASEQEVADWKKLWTDTARVVRHALGPESLRPVRVLNAALFDAVFVGVARGILSENLRQNGELRAALDGLKSDESFVEKYSRSTADALFVKGRIKAAIEAFSVPQEESADAPKD